MEVKDMNYRIVQAMNEWDPFRCGPGGYDPEIADVLFAVHEIQDKRLLAKRIQAIYEYSFDRPIALEKCAKIAEKIGQIKNAGACGLKTSSQE